MGDADQFIKRIFLDETARATGDAAAFAQAPEIATPALTPDGILTLLAAAADESGLVAPWTLFDYRAVVDFKMEGDHVDRYVLARVELRRQAAWVHHLERERPKGAAAQPGRYATLVVAPHLPDRLTDPEELGPLAVARVAPGCHAITPRDHPVVWVAANDLPLHPSLVPFLWARSGLPMVRFVRWLAGLRGVAAVVAVIQSHPMGPQITRQLIKTPDELERERERGLEMTRILLEGYPEVANEIRDEVELRALERLFARRLGRALTEADHGTLAERFRAQGPELMTNVACDLTPAELERWLAAPDGR